MTELSTAYGLQIRSELPLHLSTLDDHGGPVDVEVRFGPALLANPGQPPGHRLAHLELGPQVHYTFVRREDGGYLLRYYGLGDFELSADLRTLSVRMVVGQDPGLASVVVAGAVLSFVLLMRGEPVLHASAVVLGGTALAFVGCSGMGKSTMATLMCAQGASLLTDDVLRLDVSGHGARCHLGARELRLRKAASELAGSFKDAPAQRVTSDQRHTLRPPRPREDMAPLGAIVVPRPCRDTTETVLTRLGALEAMLTLSQFPRIVGWEDSRVHAAQFDHLATVAERVPVFIADVPWGPPFRTDIAWQISQSVGVAGW